MDLGIDPAAVAAQSQGFSSSLALIATIAFVGFFGRLVFVAFAPNLAARNPLRHLSGAGFLLLAAAIFGGGLYATGKWTKAVVLFNRSLVDPVIVSWLGRDSCDPASGRYCVVVFEAERELVVNWYDKRVYMWEIVNPPEGAPWHSQRPLSRPFTS
ncbi:hypothetical protein [Cribrihabitans neustonicus]|uniref:hypothetical protein n=1 Tax=Cribrihabitans neustonicus TaxID=1429085 RepID=UPI003B5C07CC